MIVEPYDDYLDDHHPACRGGCGQLADECMCRWPKKKLTYLSPAVTMVEPVEDDEQE